MRLITILLMMLATSAAAREPSFDMIGMQHNFDNDAESVFVQKTFGDLFYGHASYSNYPGDAWSARVGLGAYFLQTDNFAIHGRFGYFRGEIPRGIGLAGPDKINQWNTAMGFKWGFSEKWQMGANVDYSDNDRLEDYFGGLVWVKYFPFSERFGFGVEGRYSGYSNDWQPMVYATYHW